MIPDMIPQANQQISRMTIKYPILQRNLSEVESKIRSILSESDTNLSRIQYAASSDEIERKFIFLKNQLAAEFSSPHTDHHLSHLSTRLDNLHSSFASVGYSILHDQPFSSPDLDARSSCSCTDSCLDNNEDQDQVEQGDDKSTGSGVFKVHENPIWGTDEPDEDEERSGVLIHEDDHCEKGAVVECGHGYSGVPNEERSGVIHEDDNCEKAAVVECGGGNSGDYRRGVVIGVSLGAVAALGLLIGLVFHYGVRCRFDHGVNSLLFPPPT